MIEDNDEPSVVARYEFARMWADTRGLDLLVRHKLPHVFVLMEGEITLGTFTHIQGVVEFLRGVAGSLNDTAEPSSR